MKNLMKIEEKDCGWKVTTENECYYVGAYEGQGVIYRDCEAFESGEGVCYVPEYDFDNKEQNEWELFEFDAKEAVAHKIVGNPYVTKEGYTRKDFEDLVKDTPYSALDLFMSCDWQHPETLIDEWENDRAECESNE